MVEHQASWTRHEDLFLGRYGRVLRGIHSSPKGLHIDGCHSPPHVSSFAPIVFS